MSIAADLKRLGGQTLVYGAGTVLVRALAFLMLPIYTRYLTREGYGIVALSTAVSAALTILFPLSLHSAVNRLYANAADADARREVLGTLTLATWASGAVMALLFDRWGGLAAGLVSRQVPFDPYLRLAVWTAFATTLAYVPSLYLQMEQRPRAFAMLSIVQALSTVGFVVYEVVVARRGAEGYLRGTLWGTAVGSLPARWVAARGARWRLRGDLLGGALAYSLPLVIHSGAGWVLALSDRLILERYLPLDQVGLYVVAYQIASIVSVCGYAMNSAWSPHLFRKDAQEGEAARQELARLATYFFVAIAWVALGVALGARDLLVLLGAPTYREAHRVVPWLAGGMLLMMMYMIPAGFLFLKSRTAWIPVLTIAAGLVSAALNVFLAPRVGILAAGVASLAGGAALLLLVWAVAQRVYPVAYEYGRIARGLGSAAALFAVGRLLPGEPWLPMLAARVALWAAFPLLLAALGFFHEGERARFRRLLQRKPRA